MEYIKSSRFRELFLTLEKFDMVLANEAHLIPCVYCGGQLDVANYYRKTRGVAGLEPIIKFGLCCRIEGCRKRARVESIRFLGGFIYSSCFVLLISILINGDRRRFVNLCRRFGLSYRTIKRWQVFWDKVFIKTSFWKEQKGKVPHFFQVTRLCQR